MLAKALQGGGEGGGGDGKTRAVPSSKSATLVSPVPSCVFLCLPPYPRKDALAKPVLWVSHEVSLDLSVSLAVAVHPRGRYVFVRESLTVA